MIPMYSTAADQQNMGKVLTSLTMINRADQIRAEDGVINLIFERPLS